VGYAWHQPGCREQRGDRTHFGREPRRPDGFDQAITRHPPIASQVIGHRLHPVEVVDVAFWEGNSCHGGGCHPSQARVPT
jgi:hypothetical protein